jgi:hypothetical protein
MPRPSLDCGAALLVLLLLAAAMAAANAQKAAADDVPLRNDVVRLYCVCVIGAALWVITGGASQNANARAHARAAAALAEAVDENNPLHQKPNKPGV